MHRCHVSSHVTPLSTNPIQVAHKFAIGSKGMYTYGAHSTGSRPQAKAGGAAAAGSQQQQPGAAHLCLSTTYPPGNGLLDDMGDNLLELGFLGRGAGSVEVVKALHFPSMRMVAVKKVPIDDPAKLAQAIHELEQLMTNQVRRWFGCGAVHMVSLTIDLMGRLMCVCMHLRR